MNGVQVVAICPENDMQLPAALQSLPCITRDYEAMLDQVDSVYLISHPSKHYHQICKAFEKGKHVLCEAPVSLTRTEREKLTLLAKEHSCILMDGIIKRPDIIDTLIEVEREGKAWITEKLCGAGYEVISKEGNYVLFKPHRPSKEIVSLLKEKGVWVRDYSRGILAGWIRVSTGSISCMEKFCSCLISADR